MRVDEIVSDGAKRLLVIVHPGSACGSADFNQGKSAGQANREFLARDINTWHGSVLVIDGELSDELSRYPELDTAIKNALQRAKTGKLISVRMYGDDNSSPNQGQVAKQFIKQMKLNPSEWRIELTGAWVDGNTGCVVGVRNVFNRLGFSTDIRDSALVL